MHRGAAYRLTPAPGPSTGRSPSCPSSPTWATRGAAWLDAGHWVIWLGAAGHASASAERWAAGIPSRRTAPAEGVTAFAAASANVWSEIGNADPDPWTVRLATAATAWHAHRRTG
ncbi:hypothetical protein [Streptomyces sp. NPDC093071]|uniref:hypothetical protein n=1 Tax=Streptomyces sp. NPDC093071 TaxID=3366022 RepID=UPI00381B4202